MNDSARSLPALQPDPVQAELAVADARRLFQRILSAWVCDLLTLRQTGRDRPVWEVGDGEMRWHEAA